MKLLSILLLFVTLTFAKYDSCEQAQVLSGESDNIYIEDLEEKTAFNGYKGVFVKVLAKNGYHIHSLDGSNDKYVSIMKVSADCKTVSDVKPLSMSVANTEDVTYFIGVEEKSEVKEVTVVAEKMLVSNDPSQPIIIREEYIPLKFPVHTLGGNIYYTYVARHKAGLNVIFDIQQVTSVSAEQDKKYNLTFEAAAGIYELEFKYAETSTSNVIVMDIKEEQPSIINSVFVLDGYSEMSNDCSDEASMTMSYKSSGKGKVRASIISSTLKNAKVLIQSKDKCYDDAVDVDGDYYVHVIAKKADNKGVVEGTVISTVGYITEENDESESGSGESGMTTETLIAIICTSIIIGLLLLIAVALLVFIIIKKFTKKNEYSSFE